MAKSSSSVKRRRRPSQKGVQAVFTPESGWKERAKLASGLITIGIGAFAWVYSTRALGELGLSRVWPWDTSLSAILLPLSIPLLISGVGLITYYVATRKTWRASVRIESALSELEALIGQTNPLGESGSRTVQAASPPAKSSTGVVSKALFVAVVIGVLLVAVYGGLVREYVSNAHMQTWVRANFALGIYFLNYNSVLATAGIVGVLIFRLLPKKLGKTST